MAAVTALSQGISTHDRLTQKVGDLFEETALLSSRPRRPKQINTNPPANEQKLCIRSDAFLLHSTNEEKT